MGLDAHRLHLQMRMFRRIAGGLTLVLAMGAGWGGSGFGVAAAELKPATAKAFQEYVKAVEARMEREVNDPEHFLWVDGLPDEQKQAILERLRNGEVVIRQTSRKGHESTTDIPGGLVHHWVSTVFVPGATADQVLRLSQEYSRYGELYKPDIQSATVLSGAGQHVQVRYRLYRHAIVTVVYNAEFDIDDFLPESSRNYSVAHAVRIAEVRNAGKDDESEYPVGKDHGYLWNLNFYSRWVERDGGVYLQVEFVALSRSVPVVFAWLVNPYLRSVPQDYLRRNLEATRTALRAKDAEKSSPQRTRRSTEFAESWGKGPQRLKPVVVALLRHD